MGHKRGPKGPRKYTGPKPMGRLIPIAPKVEPTVAENKSGPVVPGIPTFGLKKHKTGRKKTATADKDTSTKSKDTAPQRNSAAESSAPLNAVTDLDPFNISDYTMDTNLLGTGTNATIDPSASTVSTISTPYQDLHPTHFHSLHNSPHQHLESQNLLSALSYTSPHTTFSPALEPAHSTFSQIYHSPQFAQQSGHVTPRSAISPLNSIHNSPQTFRSTIETQI